MTPDHKLKQEIIAEILAIWPDLPSEFYGWHLARKVRANVYKINMKIPYESSVLRYLRQLRDEGKVKYDVIRSKSLYIKL